MRRLSLVVLAFLGVLAAPASAAVTVSAPRVTEGGELVFTVTTDGLDVVQASTGGGTATAGTDYEPVEDENVNFGLDGTDEVTVTTTEDTAPEIDETVQLTV